MFNNSLKFLLPLLCCAVACLFSISVFANENIILVSDKQCHLPEITKNDIFDLYLGRKTKVGDHKVIILDWPDSTELRKDFFKQYVSMSLASVNAYWARLQFTGKVYPPEIMQDEADLMNTLRKYKCAIGYIYSSSLTDDLKVLCCD